MFSLKKLQREFKEINEKGEVPFTVSLVDENSYYKWNVLIEGPENSIYEGGLFAAAITFPRDYPNNPPQFVFTSHMWHPNIYPNGEVCISILHPPVHDQFNEKETLDEKWRPVLGVKEIVISILSMLTSPNLDSPANVDAAKQYKGNYSEFKAKVRKLMDDS